MGNKKTYKPEIGPQIRHAAELEMGIGMHSATLGQVWQVVIMAVLIALVFDSQGLLDWCMKLPAGGIGDRIVEVMGWWHDSMDDLGLTEVRQTLREAFRWFQGL